jgi:hypothetical protein
MRNPMLVGYLRVLLPVPMQTELEVMVEEEEVVEEVDG